MQTVDTPSVIHDLHLSAADLKFIVVSECIHWKGFFNTVDAVAKDWVQWLGGHSWITRFLAWRLWDESWQSRPEHEACLPFFFSSDKIFDDEDSVDGNRPSSASSSTSSKAPANSRRVGMGTTRRLGSAALGSKSSSKLIAYMSWPLYEVLAGWMLELIAGTSSLPPRFQ